MLVACGASESELEDARYLSCSELSRKIGRLEQQQFDADLDSLAGAFGSVLGDTEREREDAELDEALGSIDGALVGRTLEQYNAIYREKRCR
ncbi:hypothetical protein [Cochlodiniinecator piscidefendens]|uniref:hypothetical protein n=1 Tax=Cochlodiniinecator piscidefendens TaxID=2715756 RepID=UPI0014082484|nr:hypothetical protein [Cochlodiniinecator piscidefendens]